MNVTALYYYIAHELRSFLRVYDKASDKEETFTLRVDVRDELRHELCI